MITALLLASVVRFGIVSDTHVKDAATSAEMEKVFVRFRERGVDAVLHCGDLTNRGGADEFAEFAKAWKGAFAETGRLVVAFGNRDIAGAERVASDFGEVGVRSSCIGGVWVVAADCGHEGELEDYFRAHPEIGSSRGPIVTLQHKHHRGTIFGGRIADWMAGDERSTCWHRMFPNMISFSGHSHVANLGDNAFWKGDFTAVAAGSCCFEKGTETGGREIAFLTLDGLKAELERVDLRTGRAVTNAFEIVRPKDSLVTDGRAIVFRHWNIGHFSHGRSAATAIGGEESAARAADYRRELSRQEPDVLGFSEYDATFDRGGGRTRGILLDGWADVDEGRPDGYQCNALAVRTGRLSNRRSAFYAAHTQKTHYTAAEVEVRGVRFVVVETHLDLGSPDLRRAQIAELLSAFANEPRVVIAGDFNVSDVSEYGPFAAAGYVAALPAGDGFLPTHRRRSLVQTPSIDNVFVRGFRFADVVLGDYGMAFSDHRSLVCALVPTGSDALPSGADEIFRRDRFMFLNILPCRPGKEELVAKDAIEYAERTGNPYVLYSLTLHPQGRPAMKTVDACIGSYRRFARLLEGSPAKPAILLQAIIGHWTQDLAVKEAEPWQHAINVRGEVTRYCPLDPGYRDYIRTVGRRMAECRPALILSDDDVRSFSPHAECFCPLHTAEYNRRTGRNLTPEEYRALILRADYRSPEHRAFTDLQRDTIAGVCRLIREGIDAVDPSIPAGVCEPGWMWSSHDIVDYAHAIAKKDQVPFFRLGNGIYTEGLPKAEIAWGTLFTQSSYARFRSTGALMLDEADTFPQNLFSKSAIAFHAKLAVGAFIGLSGAKAWCVNSHKGDIPVSRHYTDVLAEHRGYYDAIVAAIAGGEETGVLIPCHPEFPCESAAHRRNIRTFDDRCWADLVFGNFGIPFRATYDFTSDGVYALAGTNAVARFSDEQLRQLLSRRIMIEGGAARALVARGFGKYLGVEILGKAPLFTGDYDEMHKRSMPFPRSVKPVIYRADPSARTLSTLIWRESAASTDFERVSPSAVVYRNALGGLVAPLSFHNDMSCTYMYTEARKEFILGVLAELGGAPLENVCGNAQNVMALARRDAEGRDLVLFENLNFDAEKCAVIRRAAKPSAIEELDAHGVWRAVDFAYADGEAVVKGPWPCMDVRIFRIASGGEAGK